MVEELPRGDGGSDSRVGARGWTWTAQKQESAAAGSWPGQQVLQKKLTSRGKDLDLYDVRMVLKSYFVYEKEERELWGK